MSTGQKSRILVVDDDEGGRYSTARILKNAGYEVIEAANGTDALRLSEDRPDLVVLDVNLPDINGMEVCKRIKSNPRTFDLHVIHLSATCVQSQDRVAGLDVGADGYLVKPVEAEELIATINAFLRLHKVERELREAGKVWQTTFDAMHDSVCLLDADSRIKSCNRTMAELCGLDPKALKGRPCWEVVHGATQAVPDCPVVRMKTSHKRERSGIRLGERWFDVTADPVLDENQVLRGAVHVLRDVTQRKESEAEQVKLEAQLRHSQKMEAIGCLAGGIAHDFNNMLNVILGYSELAQGRLRPDDPTFKDLEEITKAGEHSAELTKQLLAFARKQVISPRILDFNSVVETVLNMLRRLIGENISLTWKPSNGPLMVNMDPAQIDVILTNLAVNARDAITGGGKVTIEAAGVELDDAYCSLHAGSTPGKHVRLSVIDNGVGMDKATLGRLFEPFFTTKGIGKGTGLGLATVYGIVKQNQGSIDVFSEPGKGSTFNIFFPRSSEKGSEKKLAEAPLREVPTQTLLMVEDEPTLLELGKKMLERRGYKVLSVDNPLKAIELVQGYQGEIHLLLTDVIMPELNGIELWKRLQKLRPGLKCLFVSGYNADIVARQGILDGSIHFLSKPYSGEKLAAHIRAALTDRGPVLEPAKLPLENE